MHELEIYEAQHPKQLTRKVVLHPILVVCFVDFVYIFIRTFIIEFS
jgi:hypothetical protein